MSIILSIFILCFFSAQMIASDKCYQLAKRLNQMMMTTAYENVEVIVNQIVQCITNVLIVSVLFL